MLYNVPGNSAILLRPLAALFAASLLTPGALHATTAVSTPVGFVRHEIKSGFQVVGVPLLHQATMVAPIAAVAPHGTLTLNTTVNLGPLLEAGRPYYVEFTQGPANGYDRFVGDRLEVDVAATIAGESNRLFIVADDATNTMPGSGIDLAGYQATLRAHVTIADVFGAADNQFMQAGDADHADELYLYDATAGRFRSFYFSSTQAGAAWRAEDGTIADNLAIRPGEGVLVNRRSAVATATITMGEVRTNDFVQPLKAGLNFVAEGSPIDQTPRGRLMDQADGFHAASNAADADKIYVFSLGAWHQYFLFSTASGAYWCNPAKPLADYSDSTLFRGTEAVLIFRGTDFPDYVNPSQIN